MRNDDGSGVCTDADRWIYRAGGIAGLGIAAGYVAIIAVYAPMGAPPHDARPLLDYMAAHPGAWWAILALSVLTDLLFLPVAMALYLALQRQHRGAMLVAAACLALFAILDLAITWTNYAALLQLSVRYADAGAGAAQRSAIVAIAEYPAMIAFSKLLFCYNTLVPAIGVLTAGWVMRRGVFAKSTAWTGIATGVLGVWSVVGAFAPQLPQTVVLASLGTTIWMGLSGFRLWQLGTSRGQEP